MNQTVLKKFMYNFIINSMIFYITTQIITGIQTPDQLLHWFMVYAMFAVANALVNPCLKFMALPRNFFTYLLLSIVLGFGAIYIMSLVLPGIHITESIIDPMSLGIISVSTYLLPPMLTILSAAIVSGILNSILYTLKKE